LFVFFFFFVVFGFFVLFLRLRRLLLPLPKKKEREKRETLKQKLEKRVAASSHKLHGYKNKAGGNDCELKPVTNHKQNSCIDAFVTDKFLSQLSANITKETQETQTEETRETRMGRLAGAEIRMPD
jgi:hypothetical protein